MAGGWAAARFVAKSKLASALPLAAIAALITGVVLLYAQYRDHVAGAYAAVLAAILPAAATAVGVLGRVKQYLGQAPEIRDRFKHCCKTEIP